MSSQTQILPFTLLFCVSDTFYPEVSGAEGKGTYVIEIKVLPENGLYIDPSKGTQFNERVANGTLRNGRQIQIIGATENEFTELVSRIKEIPCRF